MDQIEDVLNMLKEVEFVVVTGGRWRGLPRREAVAQHGHHLQSLLLLEQPCRNGQLQRVTQSGGGGTPIPENWASERRKIYCRDTEQGKVDMDIEKSEDELELERLVFGESSAVKDRLSGRRYNDLISNTDLEHLDDDQVPLFFSRSPRLIKVILHRCRRE